MSFDLPPALVVLPGPRAVLARAGEVRVLDKIKAREVLRQTHVIIAHAATTAMRLGLSAPPRTPRLHDALELFAFVRPARFCAPSAAGVALAMGMEEPKGAEAQALALSEACRLLLEETASWSMTAREEATAQAETLLKASWPWAELLLTALRRTPIERPWRGSGLEVWSRLNEWEDSGPPGEAGSAPLAQGATTERLAQMLAAAGLSEARPHQADYAEAAAFAFQPREREGEPRMMLAEAGTGVGKTLGYLAPASLWSQANGGPVWISTFTRALQRQIERESRVLYPDPAVRARKAVVRKGRENYLCLLNFQETVQAAQLGEGDLIGLTLAARWVRATRDGDMTGGDFPAHLPTLFSIAPMHQAGPANLVDRRGECLHAGCSHYRACFIEKSVRASKRADLVIANHALVMSQAAFDGARAAGGLQADGETTSLRRIVFDEGHHLFDAADSAFSAALSGVEAAELRRWIRGPEAKGRRGRGLEARLSEIIGEHEGARLALRAVLSAALALPGEGWSGRIAPQEGEAAPYGPVETFLARVIDQLRARSDGGDGGMECAARPALAPVREAAGAAAVALGAVGEPLNALAKALRDVLDEQAEDLSTPDRARIEGALRGLDRRGGMVLPAWRAMLTAIHDDAEDDERFVDWFEANLLFGRVVDAAARRHYVDPTEPLAASVIAPAHGVLVTSATLADPGLADPFALAEMRTGAARMPERPATLRLLSPFDYERNARAFVVTDLARDDPRQVAAAMRELFLASGGGALGLFTAIRRLKLVHQLLGAPLGQAGLALYAQHVDPLETGALVDIFRAEVDSCLLGTDAVRDGVDVPGRALRLLVFDRVPWPRPDLLHKARRERFGGRSYDDAVTRGRLAQSFGRLIRREDDRGVFVMLDAAAPTRLFSSLPPGVTIERRGLADVVAAVREFLNAPAQA